VTGFFDALEQRARDAASLLCVGIDPRAGSPAEARRFSLGLIEATAPAAAAFKPNAAFFEALGPGGIETLVEVVAAVPAEIPVILDAKRGDIASTAEAYARACFDVIGAGSVTVSPYLGRDAVDPFLDHPGRGVWVLCRTSNPSASELQDAGLAGGDTVADRVAVAAAGWGGPDRLGLVVGATAPDALAAVRAAVPEHWILAPGVGPQGGDLDAVAGALREDGLGVLVPVSRAIATAPDPGSAATGLRDALRRLEPRPRRVPGWAVGLHRTECVRFGAFELRSGVVSSIYVDLRRLVSHPALLRDVAAALSALLGGIAHEHLGAVPYGALPIATAVALGTGSSMVWPRREPKAHGTGARVEGAWRPGDRVVLVDDVATSGTSALEAAALLRSAGLVVEDLVVLVERDPAASVALAAEGIRLHAVTTLPRLVDDLVAAGVVGEEERAAVRSFLDR
jgi:uridine monophosphate synthetase